MNEKTTGERIKQLRENKTISDDKGKRKPMTQKQLADILHTDVKTVRSWEKDITKPDFVMTDMLCNILGCDPDYLFLRINDPTHVETDIHNKTGLSEVAIKALTTKPIFADSINGQGECLSWYIEKGLISLILNYSVRCGGNNVERNSMSHVPKSLVPMLDEAFNKSLDRHDLKGRQSDYINRIVIILLSKKPTEIAEIKRRFDDYTFAEENTFMQFEQFYPWVIEEADKQRISTDDRKTIATIANCLFYLSFSYFEMLYEMPLRRQIAVNEFNNYLEQYEEKAKKPL